MTELLLDPAIRTWVFLPVILITFLVGVLRHYVALIFTTRKKLEEQQVQDRYLSSDFLKAFYIPCNC